MANSDKLLSGELLAVQWIYIVSAILFQPHGNTQLSTCFYLPKLHDISSTSRTEFINAIKYLFFTYTVYYVSWPTFLVPQSVLLTDAAGLIDTSSYCTLAFFSEHLNVVQVS